MSARGDGHTGTKPVVSVIVPSWRRVASLERCLRAIAAQSLVPDEVVVGIRSDDQDSARAVASMAREYAAPLRCAFTADSGVVAAMNAALAACRPDSAIIALTDDDTEPQRDWLERLTACFDDPRVGGSGGRDWQPHERGDRSTVGKVQWFGRMIGNHHLGAGPARDVDVLKGANCAYRAPPLRASGFDTRLAGDGAQLFWELALCLPMRRAGWRLVYDPAIAVEHHIEPRSEGDQLHRGVFASAPLSDATHNETLVLLENLRGVSRAAFMLWALLVGTRHEPGLAQIPRLLLRGDAQAFARWCAALDGRMRGWSDWRTGGAGSHELPPPAMKPLRVLVVMPLGAALGGGEQMLRQLLVHGRGQGMEWIVVFLRDGPLAAEMRALGLDVRVIEAGRFRNLPARIRAIGRIAKLARSARADLVLGWMVAGQLTAGAAAILAGIPSVWFQVGTPRPDWLDRIATLLPARGVLVLSRAAGAAQARVWPRRKQWLVYPGASLDAFDPVRLASPSEARATLGLSVPGPLIGMVGRLQRWKGMHVFIAAMSRVHKLRPDVRAVIVGAPHETEPAYADELRAQSTALGLDGVLTFAGFQSNVPDWMQAMDVFVHASDREPFGIVVIEAMALGKPVIAGAAGGPAEIITDGVDGVLVPYGDDESLAHAILRYLGDREFAARVGAAARIRAAVFSDRTYAAQVIAALRESVS